MPRSTCSKCGAPLDTSHRSYCRQCLAEYARQNRKARGEQARTYQREYRRKWVAEHPEKRAQYARQALYGMSQNEFEEWLAVQDGRCAICGIVLVEGRGPEYLAVDHVKNSDPPVVRGLLCQRCNLFIGQADHDIDLLFAAVQYLRGSVVER